MHSSQKDTHRQQLDVLVAGQIPLQSSVKMTAASRSSFKINLREMKILVDRLANLAPMKVADK